MQSSFFILSSPSRVLRRGVGTKPRGPSTELGEKEWREGIEVRKEKGGGSVVWDAVPTCWRRAEGQVQELVKDA